MEKIAIVAVSYNRPQSLVRLLNSLDQAYYGEYQPSLIISVDKSNSDDVERVADNYVWKHGEKIVDKHSENFGLKKHMLSLGKWFDTFDAIVVLEDDIVVSPCYFSFCVQCVSKYEGDSHIAGISLYGFEINYQTSTPFIPVKDENDVYFMNCAMSWGELWMKDSWLKFYNWYQNNIEFTPSFELPDAVCRWGKKSWLKFHTTYCIKNNLYFVFPYYSLSTNCSEAGEHNAKVNTAYQTNLQRGDKLIFGLPDFKESSIKYDGFFERKSLPDALGLNPEEVCIDLYGTQYNRVGKRYWLTTAIANFKIVRCFGLYFRPIEINVINNIEGTGIFLYDTSCICGRNKVRANPRFLLFLFHIDDFLVFIRMYGLESILKNIKDKIKNKIKKYV